MVAFLLLTTIDNTRELREALAEIRAEYGDILSMKKIYFSDWERGAIDPAEVEKAVRSSRIILVDIRGQTEFTDRLQDLLAGRDAAVVVLVGGSRDILSLARLGSFSGADLPQREGRFDIEAYLKAKKFMELAKRLGSVLPVGKLKHMRNWLVACEYYAEGGKENLKNLFLFLAREYGGARVKAAPPRKRPEYGIWWPPDRYYSDLRAFKSAVGWQADKPAVGVFFYGGMHLADCLPVVEALVKELRGEVNLVPVFSKVEQNLAWAGTCTSSTRGSSPRRWR